MDDREIDRNVPVRRIELWRANRGSVAIIAHAELGPSPRVTIRALFHRKTGPVIWLELDQAERLARALVEGVRVLRGGAR